MLIFAIGEPDDINKSVDSWSTRESTDLFQQAVNLFQEWKINFSSKLRMGF